MGADFPMIPRDRLPFGISLHEDQPAEEEAMTTTLHVGHAAKHNGHKTGKMGEGHQHAQRYLHRGYREKSGRWKFSLRLYTFTP
jgi:hypothetical protein